MFNNFFRNKSIIITGHTGFKGSWLTFWLSILGAKINGVSLKHSYLSKKINNNSKIKNNFFNIEDKKKLEKLIKKIEPDIIFHLAAQAIVADSYRYPFKTWSSNTVGMLNLMESLKVIKKKCSVIIITSDKVYKNIEQKKGYKEDDILHGLDPYSASKSCADILAQSYINSILCNNTNINFGIARAGNVIGGGDFSNNRIIPDLIKSSKIKKKLILRQPNSTRPWQHVIEIIYGYLTLSKYLYLNKKCNLEILNFGPKKNFTFKVIDIVKEAKKYISFDYKVYQSKSNFKESILLKLNSSRAYNKIGWKSVLGFRDTIKYTMEWYKISFSNLSKDIKKITNHQINKYYKKNKIKINEI